MSKVTAFGARRTCFCAGHVVGERTTGANGNHSVVFCFLCRCCLGLMEESCNGFVCGVFEGIGL